MAGVPLKPLLKLRALLKLNGESELLNIARETATRLSGNVLPDRIGPLIRRHGAQETRAVD